MSPRPGRIIHEFNLPFSKQFLDGINARSVKASPEFIEIREEVMAIIFSDVEGV
jgi:taurine transport system ATP-binding protein